MSQLEAETPTTTFPSACPHCNAPLRFCDSVWNIRTKKRVQVLECTGCRKLAWND